MADGIRVFPGQWRPEYPGEQIAWVRPPWPSDGYVWLDFPEAVFSGRHLLFLSHISATFQQAYPYVPRVPWRETVDGIAFHRTLPNGIGISGSVTVTDERTIGLELHLSNGTDRKLGDVRIQTCAYLRAIREFADYTNDNKFVHVADRRWLPLSEALDLDDDRGAYHVGWRSGPQAADLPLVVTRSARAERLVAMTWRADTYSLVGNPDHPCMHADPFFEDLLPGECETIHGELVFFDGTLADFEAWWRGRPSGP